MPRRAISPSSAGASCVGACLCQRDLARFCARQCDVFVDCLCALCAFLCALCGRASHGIIFRFRVMDDYRCRALLGEQLERFGEIHAQGLLCGKQPEYSSMVIEIGTGAVPPRVALSSAAGFVVRELVRCFDAELTLDPTVQPFGDRFGGLYAEPM